MAVNLSPVGGVAAQFFDNNGNPLTGGKIYTYAAGTTTNQTTYTSSSGLTPHSNPIILDSAGRVPSGEIWLTDGLTYKFVIKNANDITIGTYDNIVGINSNFVNFTSQQEIQVAIAGQTVFNLTTMQYQPNSNNLMVFVDGVNQYGPGSSYAYVETDADTVTFTSGLHVGAEVKFTTATPINTSATIASAVAFTPAGANAVTRTAQEKMREYLSRNDYTTQAAAEAELIAGTKIYLNNQDSFEITVGTGGETGSINVAIEAAVRMRPIWKEGNSYCTIRLLTGFVMQEQVLIEGGVNLGWIKIVADDALTTIDYAYITEYLDTLDDLIPAFGARENSVLPTIGCQFEYASSLTSKDGVAVILGSKVGFMPESGITKARNGLKVLYDSEAYCYMEGLTVGGDGTGAGTVTGVDFSYAANRGCHLAYGSRALLARSNFSYSGGDYGVYCIWGSYGDLYQSNASHATGTAFIARDGSFLNCRECNASYSVRGFHALHNGRINARSRLTGPTMIWVGDGAKGCTEYGVLASACSQIDADSLNCDDNTGSAAVSASGASSINFTGGTAKNAANRGVWSVGSSIVDAIGVDVSGSLQAGFVAQQGGSINCEDGIATDCVTNGVFADSGSRINAQGVDASRCNRGVEAQEGCIINFRNGIADDCGDRGVSAIDGSMVNCQDVSAINAVNYGITCRNAGNVAANNADCSGAGINGLYVLSGGIAAFTGGSGTTNITVNTLTANGIIFQ
jgi:hypothetical protein